MGSEDMCYVLRNIDRCTPESAALCVRAFDTHPHRFWLATGAKPLDEPGLADRFGALTIQLPRLLDRKEDIQLFAQRFAAAGVRPNTLVTRTTLLATVVTWPGTAS